MRRRSHQTAWTVVFVVVVLVGAVIMVVKFAGQEEPPLTGLPPSELHTGTARPPARPGDATVLVRVTSAEPMVVACAQVPTAVREKDREFCVQGGRSLERRMRVNGPLVYITTLAQAGDAGANVRCTIKVSGKAKDRQSNSGAYQWTYCHAFTRVF